MSYNAQADAGMLARMIRLRVLSSRRCGNRLSLRAIRNRTLLDRRTSGVEGGVALHNSWCATR